MCTRYVQSRSLAEYARPLGLPDQTDPGTGQSTRKPTWNMASSRYAWLVHGADDGAPRFAFHQWGLLPSWAEDPAAVGRPINASAETAASKAVFGDLLKRKRCLIAADGFYEWKLTASRRVPHYVTLARGGPLFFGGIWDRWGAGDEEIDSYAVLTVPSNDLLRPIHARMPAIISPDNYARWLDPRITDRAEIESMMSTYPASQMMAWEVSKRVNKPGNDGSDLIEPVNRSPTR